MKEWNAVIWDTVVFTYEKKFNLDVVHGLSCYWNDLRKEPVFFSVGNKVISKLWYRVISVSWVLLA